MALRVSVEAPLCAGVESPLRLVSPAALHKAGKGTDPRTGFFRYPLLRGTLAWWFSSCSSPSFSSSLCWAWLFLLLTDRRELDVSIASLVFHVEGEIARERKLDGYFQYSCFLMSPCLVGWYPLGAALLFSVSTGSGPHARPSRALHASMSGSNL